MLRAERHAGERIGLLGVHLVGPVRQRHASARPTSVAPLRVVVSVWTSSSGAPATGRRIFTVTSAESPGALPAAPPRSGVVSLVAAPFAGVVSVTAGSVVSTVQVALAGVGSTLPAGSIARTWNVCVLSESPV